MAAPGLLLIEAAMGEGKTEAALAAVEVLARRFGADGVFVGMPTQATSDPMFSRVRAWAGQIEAGIPVGLLHGKRRFNPEWKRLEKVVSVSGVDEFGCVDEYGVGPEKQEADRPIPAEWLLGPKRGLLSAVTVGTVDHLLYAATRTRHVMLRHAGLAGRVVVLDEIHAYDAYMSQFLFEALRWLADAGEPVVLLSATLPPEARRRMVTAYLQDATQKREIDLAGLPEPVGYPHALSVCTVDGTPHFTATVSEPWRPSRAVDVRIGSDISSKRPSTWTPLPAKFTVDASAISASPSRPRSTTPASPHRLRRQPHRRRHRLADGRPRRRTARGVWSGDAIQQPPRRGEPRNTPIGTSVRMAAHSP